MSVENDAEKKTYETLPKKEKNFKKVKFFLDETKRKS